MPPPNARIRKLTKKEKEKYKKGEPILIDDGTGKPFYLSRKKLLKIKEDAEKGIMPSVPERHEI
jgi:hypothetical protein